MAATIGPALVWNSKQLNFNHIQFSPITDKVYIHRTSKQSPNYIYAAVFKLVSEPKQLEGTTANDKNPVSIPTGKQSQLQQNTHNKVVIG